MARESEEALLARMEVGLYSLQQAALLVGHIWSMGELPAQKRILLVLHQQARDFCRYEYITYTYLYRYFLIACTNFLYRIVKWGVCFSLAPLLYEKSCHKHIISGKVLQSRYDGPYPVDLGVCVSCLAHRVFQRLCGNE